MVRWDDPGVDWSRFDEVVLRSPWDCPSRPADFLAWYEDVARKSRVHNPFPLVSRNQHKQYLVELAAAGVAVVPTVVVTTQDEAHQAARDRGWDPAVIKPAIGLGGRSVAVFRADTAPAEVPLQGAATECRPLLGFAVFGGRNAGCVVRHNTRLTNGVINGVQGASRSVAGWHEG